MSLGPNTTPKTVLAEGQALLQDLKQQQEAALHLPRPCQSCSHTCRSIPPWGYPQVKETQMFQTHLQQPRAAPSIVCR